MMPVGDAAPQGVGAAAAHPSLTPGPQARTTLESLLSAALAAVDAGAAVRRAVVLDEGVLRIVFNDLLLAGTLSGVELGLALAEVPHQPGGVQAALEYLARNQP